MGKFTVDRFGQSGPAHSPLYEVPFQVKNATHLLYRYEADREEVEDILPPGCELKDGPAYVWALVQSSEHQCPMRVPISSPSVRLKGMIMCLNIF